MGFTGQIKQLTVTPGKPIVQEAPITFETMTPVEKIVRCEEE